MAAESQDMPATYHSDSVSNVLGQCILNNEGITLVNMDGKLQVQANNSGPTLLDHADVKPEEETVALPPSLPRKSDRERRERRSFSPEHHRNSATSASKGRRRKGTPHKLKTEESERKIQCELCFSPYVTNPLNQHAATKNPRYRPSWRTRVNRDNGKLMMLCNACGLAYDRPAKVQRVRRKPRPEDKERYMTESKDFAASLVKEFNDPDAERLACPHFKNEGCGCIQKYVMSDGTVTEYRKRAMELLGLLKKAKELSQKKFYDPEKVYEVESKGCKRQRNIGLGNGQKRSKEFEDFILHHRRILRDDIMLCERATQRVLMYSNNFLHKKLKTEARPCRVERTKGKYHLGLLKPVKSLIKEKCCTFRCVRMAVSLASLLEEWRTRAASGQREARRVIAEMLTPSGGTRPNCYNFIEMVTGCSFSTIGKVNEQMRESGGSREPPAHGMCHYWKNHPQRKRLRVTDLTESDVDNDEQARSTDQDEDSMIAVDTAGPSAEETAEAALSLDPFHVEVIPISEVLAEKTAVDKEPDNGLQTVATAHKQWSTGSSELLSQRQQIASLQKQLAAQQLQLQQQQQLLQQQMLHQVLFDQLNGSSGVQIQTLQSLQQLLNLQQQYQQQQLQQINQLDEQTPGVNTATATTSTDTTTTGTNPAGNILSGSDLLQLPSGMTMPQLLSTQVSETPSVESNTNQQHPVLFMPSLDATQQALLQQQLVLQPSADSLIAAGVQNSDLTQSIIPATQAQDEAAVSTDQLTAESTTISTTKVTMDGESEKQAVGGSMESVVQIPVSTSNSVNSIILPAPTLTSTGKASTVTPNMVTPTVLQQVIDLGQLGFGLQSLTPTQNPGAATLLSTDTSQVLSNLNITLVQPTTSSGNGGILTAVSDNTTGVTQTLPTVVNASDLTDLVSSGAATSIMGTADESLSQLLASNLGYTVLTIEPGVTADGVAPTDKVSADNQTFIDIDVNPNQNNSVLIPTSEVASTDKSSVIISNIGGVKVLDSSDIALNKVGSVSVSEPSADMNSSEVFQLLAQHDMAVPVSKPGS